VIQPMLDLDRAGFLQFRVSVENMVTDGDLRWADLIIFCRNVEHYYHATLEKIIEKNIPFIYDIDDNFYEIPLELELGVYHRDPDRLEMMSYYIKYARLVRVYSDPVYQRCIELNANTIKVAAPINWSLIEPPVERIPDKVRIVYATSRTHDHLSKIFLPPLQEVVNQHAGQVDVYFWGTIPETVKNQPGFNYLAPVPNYNRFLKEFSRRGFDIGLAPLLDDIFYRSKTNNKFREYGAAQIAGIYSDVDVYRSCVVHGETGLLVANDPQCWYEGLNSLIESPTLCRHIQQQAYQFTQAHYTQIQFDAVWKSHLEMVLENSTRVVDLPPLPKRVKEPKKNRKKLDTLAVPRRSFWKRLWGLRKKPMNVIYDQNMAKIRVRQEYLRNIHSVMYNYLSVAYNYLSMAYNYLSVAYNYLSVGYNYASIYYNRVTMRLRIIKINFNMYINMLRVNILKRL
jgi:hypothetical protein